MTAGKKAAVSPCFRSRPALALAPLAALLAACGGGGGGSADLNVRPAFVRGDVATKTYDGTSDDLLTAGLGRTGLQAAALPAALAPANPASPTAAELRRVAIHTNYRALVDVTANGGFGTLYGPNVDASGNATAGEGRIAGTETLAYADDGSGRENVTMMVQVPATFDPANACIVLAASSGSRGVYGAIGTAGEWGLKRGCAVAYTDKGTGNGIHDLQNNTVSLRDGTRATAAAAGIESNFTAPITEAQRQSFVAANPFRFAVKQAHSQLNPEKDWGRHGLQAVEFAFYVLNERFGEASGTSRTRRLVPANTLVIASSVSNGGAVAIAAAEQDTQGLIDGVAVGEPQIQVVPNNSVAVRRGATTLPGTGRSLYDYTTLANLLQPCAGLATPGAPATALLPLNATVAANRCAALAARGLVSGSTTAAQAADALARLTAAGWEPSAGPLHASHYTTNAVPGVALTYANAYGRFSVLDKLCGLTFATTNTLGSPAAPSAAGGVSLAQSFGLGNGVPPTVGINIVNENSPGGPLLDAISLSPSNGQADYDLDAAVCLRNLHTGSDASAQRVRQGIDEVLRNGNLRGKPTIIVHGRSDALVPPAFSSRPYVALNRAVEGANAKVSYIEVTNAQHFDGFLSLPGYDRSYVPLHVYFNRAMDAMYANLRSGAALPPSQVVRTTPRGVAAGGTTAAPIAAANVPPMAASPAAGDRIAFEGSTLVIPD